MAHLAAGRGLITRGARFEYKTGLEGMRYVVAGDVQIDVSKEPDDSQATIAKAQRIRSAVLVPADPSP